MFLIKVEIPKKKKMNLLQRKRGKNFVSPSYLMCNLITSKKGYKDLREKLRKSSEYKKKPKFEAKKPKKLGEVPGSEHLYGILPVLSALKANRRKFFSLFVRSEDIGPTEESGKKDLKIEILKMAKKQNVKVEFIDRDLIETLRPKSNKNTTFNHQGIVLRASSLPIERIQVLPTPIFEYKEVAKKSQIDFAKIGVEDQRIILQNWLEMSSEEESVQNVQNKPPLWLALEEISDPVNLGTLLRTSAFFGVDGILLSEKKSCSVTPVVCKTSGGASEYVPIYSTNFFFQTLKESREKGYHCIGTAPPGKWEGIINAKQLELNKPTVLVLGNEGFGLSKEVLSLMDQVVAIGSNKNDQDPLIDSLNVGQTGSILLWQLRGL